MRVLDRYDPLADKLLKTLKRPSSKITGFVLAAFATIGNIFYTYYVDSKNAAEQANASREIAELQTKVADATKESATAQQKLAELQEKSVGFEEVTSQFYTSYKGLLPKILDLQEANAATQNAFLSKLGELKIADDLSLEREILSRSIGNAMISQSRNPMLCGDRVGEYREIETRYVMEGSIDRSELDIVFSIAIERENRIRKSLTILGEYGRIYMESVIANLEIEIKQQAEIFPYARTVWTDDLTRNMAFALKDCCEEAGDWKIVAEAFRGVEPTSEEIEQLARKIVDAPNDHYSSVRAFLSHAQQFHSTHENELPSSGNANSGANFAAPIRDVFRAIVKSQASRLERFN